MKKQFLVWIAILASLALPAISSAGEGLTSLALAYNDNLGRQGDLPVVTTGCSSGTYPITKADHGLP